MKTLYILGAGQYGQAVKEIAEAAGYEECLFLDDNSGLAVGKLAEIENHPEAAAVVAMGNPELRRQWYEKLQNPATLIHPNAVVMPSASIGPGSILEPGAVVSTGAKVGRGCILMANAVVGHDAKVGAYCQLKYNASVPERCLVPDGTKLDCNGVFGL